MDYVLIAECIICGFLLAVPIGPVNLICIRHTLSEGRMSGLVIGLGAAAADAVYGYAAAAGLNVVIEFIIQHEVFFRWGGGLFIIYLGWKTARTIPPNDCPDKKSTTSLYRLSTKIFLLTLANPVTVFTYLAIFSSLGIAKLVTSFSKAVLASSGVFLGSLLWWIILTSIVCLFRDKVTSKTIAGINKFAGIIIILVGIISIMEHHVFG